MASLQRRVCTHVVPCMSARLRVLKLHRSKSHNDSRDGRHANGNGHSLDPNAVRYTSVDEVVGSLLSAARDQNVCRFLQKKFDEGGPEAIELLFAELLEHAAELMTDPFGNYLVQKVLDRCVGLRVPALRAGGAAHG